MDKDFKAGDRVLWVNIGNNREGEVRGGPYHIEERVGLAYLVDFRDYPTQLLSSRVLERMEQWDKVKVLTWVPGANIRYKRLTEDSPKEWIEVAVTELQVRVR
ncbi:hypothetical protein LCGC14_2523400 [marine sediment metagenome]|uniref:Uncharacterized protein n=1 Tax=marine sediment metagenome TaxID=412755 RepID=A0A0F9AVR6_9ZZZZ